jgi:hypothetical protein
MSFVAASKQSRLAGAVGLLLGWHSLPPLGTKMHKHAAKDEAQFVQNV